MPRILVEHGSEEWKALRAGRITASIAADCLGMGSKSKRWAWRKVLGLEPEDDNVYMKYGRDNEHRAFLAYEMETGRCVEPGGFWVHDEHDWLAASPDGLVGDDGMVEAKCPATIPEKVPVAHRIQCLVQLACAKRKWVDYVAWVAPDGDAPEQTFIRRIHLPQYGGPSLQGLIKALARFRDDYVLKNVEPPRKKPRRAKK